MRVSQIRMERIAGPTLAFWLKAAGFEPTIIEHAPALRSGGYVIDFWGLGYDIAERPEPEIKTVLVIAETAVVKSLRWVRRHAH